ncbi:hypothetical protein ABZZ36_31425 [Actinacidiphila glaucinigra]|uniref:hypothetical protein n=1 Tax=Actinacidiphila glaucinigra TaxID=235986 RepID=UPI0033BC9F73
MDLVATTQARDAGDELRSFHSRLLDDPYVRLDADVTITLAGYGPGPGARPAPRPRR